MQLKLYIPFKPPTPSEVNPPQRGSLVKKLCQHQATEHCLKTLRDFHTEPRGKALISEAGLEPALVEDIEIQQVELPRCSQLG